MLLESSFTVLDAPPVSLPWLLSLLFAVVFLRPADPLGIESLPLPAALAR